MNNIKKIALLGTIATVAATTTQATNIINTNTNNSVINTNTNSLKEIHYNGIISNLIDRVKNFIKLLTEKPIDLSKENINETVSTRSAFYAVLDALGIFRIIPFVSFDTDNPYDYLKPGDNTLDAKITIKLSPISSYYKVFNFKIKLSNVKTWGDALRTYLSEVKDSEKKIDGTLTANTDINSKENIAIFKLWKTRTLSKYDFAFGGNFNSSVVIKDAFLINSQDNKLKVGMNTIELRFNRALRTEGETVTFTIFANAK